MIKVLHKALDIIEYVASTDEGKSLNSISSAIGEKNTTCSNIVQTLLKRNYLEKDNLGKYKLGIMAYNIVKSAQNFDALLCTAAKKPLEILAQNTQSQSVLSILRNNQKYVLLRCDSDNPVCISTNKIDAKDPYLSTTGLLLLAFRQEQEIESIIEGKGLPKIFANKPEFKKALSKIKKENLNSIIFNEKVFEMSAPVFMGDEVVAAVGLFIPSYDVTPEIKNMAVFELQKAADEIINNINKGE